MGARMARLSPCGGVHLHVSAEVNPDSFLILIRLNGGITDGKRIIGLSKAIAFRIFIPAYIELYTQGYFPFDKSVKFYILGQTNQDQASEDRLSAWNPERKILRVLGMAYGCGRGGSGNRFLKSSDNL